MASPADPKVTPAGRRRRKWPFLLGAAVSLAALGVGLRLLSYPPTGTDNAPPPAAGEPEAPPGPPWFRDVTAETGVNFTYRNGEEADQFTILESLGGGVALFDYDGDGRLDVFVTGGGYFTGPDKKEIRGYPSRLYRNLGGWKFEDVTAAVGLDQPLFYTHGCAVADYDRDGRPDLLVTGYGRLALYHNESHDGRLRFVDVTRRAGLDDTLWSSSAGWADLSGTGFPDVYVCHYLDWSFANHPSCPRKGSGGMRDVCGPQQFAPQPHAVFRNRGDGTFAPAGPEFGLRKDGYGLGVVIVDVDDDGRPDVFVGNDAGEKFLYMNRGGGRFEEVGRRVGAALDGFGLYNGTMGVDAADFDGSGRPSLWAANYQGDYHALYRNTGHGQFLYATQSAGVAALGRQFVGFGTAFLDADNDGWEDLVIANGHVLRFPTGSTLPQRPVFLRNTEFEGRRFFRDAGNLAGEYFRKPIVGRGLAVGDLDNDGWPDLVVSHSNSPVAVLRNERPEPSREWLGVKLVGRNRRDVVGSTVSLDVGARRLTRFVKGGGSYLSAGDPRILFGLGTGGKPGTLTVRWAGGEIQRWPAPEPNSYWELQEGRAEARKLTAPN